MEKRIHIVKSSGESVPFSSIRLADSLRTSGADETTVDQILQKVEEELFPGISTEEIYNRAYAMLRRKRPIYASKYKLKKAIYELGPTGFPFEKFISTLLQYSGYKTRVGQVVSGGCISHEIDVLASKNGKTFLIECKFHGEEGRNCNVKVPLYIHSRFKDVQAADNGDKAGFIRPDEGWVVTNTRFTQEAVAYGKCAGLYLLSWDFPEGDGLRNRIDRLALYPITVSTLLSGREKQFLLSRDIVLCRQLIRDTFYLDHLGVSENRKARILKEIGDLCRL
ncbi:ATP cone domain-containing protein [Muriicola jejuensis]|uniref:ATPase n=1 Tax=Muriicola jejuensis TaxID=504488 RepID=A0A6P0U750_9FLAO|nr:ATP cone domain-containing protein [Muriicola jejuensis]NER09101.1 ATPase [Muriicola jejuensis]SMP11124.1 ATP cone domain-containing protein [Muriicola jejuensis]